LPFTLDFWFFIALFSNENLLVTNVMAMHADGRGAADTLDNDEVSGAIFHFGFDGSAFLFPSLRITSWPTFIAACLITTLICLTERYVIAVQNYVFADSLSKLGT
jgi:hypothetical protein